MIAYNVITIRAARKRIHARRWPASGSSSVPSRSITRSTSTWSPRSIPTSGGPATGCRPSASWPSATGAASSRSDGRSPSWLANNGSSGRAGRRRGPALRRRPEAGLLGLAPGRPALVVDGIAYAADGRPIEFARSYVRGDRTRYYVERVVVRARWPDVEPSSAPGGYDRE